MCRNIKILFNFDPPATDEEIHDAALQFARKLSGFAKPSMTNEKPFNKAVNDFALTARQLLDSLATTAEPRNREVEAAKKHALAVRRFGT